jgi:hypothetical protein
MAITNPSALNMAIPYQGIDNIIGIHTGSFTSTAPTLLGQFTNDTDTFDTGFGDTCLFQGIFSVDGGSTWNDLGVYIPDLSTPAQPVLQTVTCQAYIKDDGTLYAVSSNWYDNVHSTSSAYTVDYKIVLLAKDSQGSIMPLSTSQILAYQSAYNFQKVDVKGSFAVSTSATTTITHDLGYIPNVRCWFAPTNTTMGSDGIYTLPAGALMTLDWFYAKTNVTVDTTTANFSPVVDNTASGIDGTMYYRIYLDGSS